MREMSVVDEFHLVIQGQYEQLVTLYLVSQTRFKKLNLMAQIFLEDLKG